MKLPIKYSQSHWTTRMKARLQYIEDQKGLCYHCSQPLNQTPPKAVTRLSIDWGLFPEGFLDNPIHLHHNHDTDDTIGAVHAYCNAVLWQYLGE